MLKINLKKGDHFVIGFIGEDIKLEGHFKESKSIEDKLKLQFKDTEDKLENIKNKSQKILFLQEDYDLAKNRTTITKLNDKEKLQANNDCTAILPKLKLEMKEIADLRSETATYREDLAKHKLELCATIAEDSKEAYEYLITDSGYEKTLHYVIKAVSAGKQDDTISS